MSKIFVYILILFKFHLFKSFHSLFYLISTYLKQSQPIQQSQIQLYYLIQQSNLIQQSHILNSVKNSIVWSRFTFSSYINSRIYSTLSQIQWYIVLSRFTFSSRSTVALIQYFHKFSCISSFTFISLSTVQTYSKVSQILLSYHISQSNLIQQSHILYSIYYSIFWSRFTFSSYSTVPFIQVSQID